MRMTVSSVTLGSCSAALIVCDAEGNVLGATPSALNLLGGTGVELGPLAAPIAVSMWNALVAQPLGEETQWRPDPSSELTLSCARYPPLAADSPGAQREPE
jgi:hypothetical protein